MFPQFFLSQYHNKYRIVDFISQSYRIFRFWYRYIPTNRLIGYKLIGLEMQFYC